MSINLPILNSPRPSDCRGCDLDPIATGFLQPEGNCSNGVLIIGEAGGANESREGLPFRPNAPAGSVLTRIFRELGLSRHSFGFGNICMCQPPKNELANTWYEESAARHCRVHFNRIVDRLKPKVILALGNVALKSLTKMAGDKQTIEHLRGYVLESPEFPSIHIIASYHPSFIVRGAWNVYSTLRRDLQFALHVARNGWNPAPPQYIEHANEFDLRNLKNELLSNPELTLSVDFETDGQENVNEDETLMRAIEDLYNENSKKQKKATKRLGTTQAITQVNFSIAPGTAVVTDYIGNRAQLVREILETPNHKIGHNIFGFDCPIAQHNGIVINGEIDDTMLCLRGDMLLARYDGGWVKLADVVEKKLQVPLMGMSRNGLPVKLTIMNWHRKDALGQKWIHIKSDSTKNPLVCTPDHQVWTVNEGWKRADEVIPGDQLQLPAYFNEVAMHGMMLGDSYIHAKSRTLRVRHGYKQKAYIKAKCNAFSGNLRSLEWLGYEAFQFTVSISPAWHKHFYDGKRRVFHAPPTYAALAVWYQDDGCFSRNRRNEKLYGNGRALLAINRFQSQADEVLQYFKRHFGIDCELVRKNKMVRISKASLKKFFDAIADYVHPSMEYKLGEAWRGRYNGWLEDFGFAKSIVTSVKIAPPARYASNVVRYCVTVDHSTHRFFTMGGLVHNCFHQLYPDLPGKRGKIEGELDGSFANLQYCASFYGFPFPWKHMVKDRPEYYGSADADSCLRLFLGVKNEMQAITAKNGVSIWDGYCKLVYNIQPILTNMQDRGIPVNQAKMLEFLRMVVREQKVVGDRIQAYIPDEMRPYSPKTGYKKTPKDTTGMVRREFFLPPSDERCKCMKLRKKDLEYWAEVPFAVVSDDGKLRAPDPACEICKGQGVIRYDGGVIERYVKLEPFNVQSPVQMKMYCKTRRYTIPKNSKNEYSMDKETLNKLAKKYQDEVFKLAISYREYDKMAGTYALGWLNGGAGDSHVHTQFTFFPATGQLSSVRPNVQTVPNVSKFGRLAEEFRQAIEADDEYSLIELDKKSYHAQTLGFEAGDPSYIRLAKIDIHSYLAACMEKVPHYETALEWEDAELKTWLKWYRKNYKLKDGTPFETLRNSRAKPGILGYGFGLGASKLYKLNEDSFNNEREAKLVLDTLDATFPKVKAFRDNIPLVAKRQGGKLVSLSGSIRWFWDIGYPRDGKFEHGSDWEKCIAFLPATDAFGDMKAIMTRLEHSGMNERYGLINQVHDSLVFHCPTKLLDEAIPAIAAEMQKPSTVLLFEDGTGLDVQVEAKVGKSWAGMVEVTI